MQVDILGSSSQQSSHNSLDKFSSTAHYLQKSTIKKTFDNGVNRV